MSNLPLLKSSTILLVNLLQIMIYQMFFISILFRR